MIICIYDRVNVNTSLSLCYLYISVEVMGRGGDNVTQGNNGAAAKQEEAVTTAPLLGALPQPSSRDWEDLPRPALSKETPTSAVAETVGNHPDDMSIAKRFLCRINDLLHFPVVEDVVWYFLWAINLLVAPLFIPLLPLVFLFDVVTGHFGVGKSHSPEGKAVLITGCDSGFGHDTALVLAKKGWKVYAGCLTDGGMESLKAKAGDSPVIPVKMVSIFNMMYIGNTISGKSSSWFLASF